MNATRCVLVGLLWVLVVGCGDNKPFIPDGPTGPQCADGVDNDGDGKTDFPDDLECESEADESEEGLTPSACDDGRDNDGDGKADYPEDPGCQLPQGDTEIDDCPTGPGCPQCANGVDDDGNGSMDYPDDPGCDSAGDANEFVSNPVACGAGMTIEMLPATGMDTGMLDGTSLSNLVTTCGGGGGAAGVAYVFHLTEPKVMVASTAVPGTMVDTVLDLRSADCANPSSHITCNNDSGTGEASSITASLAAGTYYLIVEGYDTSELGAYALDVKFFAGEGTACNTQEECGPGLVCRTPLGGSMMICTDPVCSDGADDDADGKTDFPSDPGCDNPADGTEEDDCPDGSMCPACGDGVDNDNDGMTDYPADNACSSASADNEACAGELDEITAITAGTTMGTLVGATDEHAPDCGGDGGPDKIFTLDLPEMATLEIDTNGSAFDTVLSLMNSTCGEPSIECDDDGGTSPDSLISRTGVPGGSYTIAVDAYSDSTTLNSFVVNVTGTVAPGGSCEGALFQAGALSCAGPNACNGPMGSRTCSPAQCNDGVDNNSDGVIDYPADPGCNTPGDNTETLVCPGPDCPVCSDGIDNDGDMLTDYPDDSGCAAASSTNEGCAGELDAIVEISSPTTTGTLVGASDDHDPSCGGNGGEDKIFVLEIPTLQSLVIDTEGSAVDTVLSVMNSTCGEPSLSCDDDGGVGSGDSRVSEDFVAAGLYTIAVDARSSSSTLDTFNLNVSGTIVPGGSCEVPLFQAGALTCTTGFACSGTPGSRTCSQSQCLDGIDNDGNGLMDYPFDPGCDSPSDPAEDTVCPGMDCPLCADGLDNDGDGSIDFPDDSGCTSAVDPDETCRQSEPITPITQEITTGTTQGQADDYFPSCGSSSHAAPDVALQLDLPAMATLDLTFDGFDGATTLLDSTCGGAPIKCSDPDTMELTNLVAGTYYFVVDGFGSDDFGAWTLETTGTVAPGGSCEGALFQAGAFTCAAGLACTGPVGMRTCYSECSDGVDNSGDGLIDFPEDPACDTAADLTENLVCPGAMCPVCADGIDNDGDAQTDYPDDASCFSASGITEACTQSEPISAITQRVTAGNTSGQVNDFTPECASSSHSAPDATLQLNLPTTMATLNLTFSGFDGATTLLDSTCGGTEIDCSDPNDMELTNIAAGTYYVVVDGWSSGTGPWTLTTTGTVPPGESCEGGLFQAGAFTCTSGFACDGPAGSRTCVTAQCADGIDNNTDSVTDFPDDPGCDSPSDHTETTVCPGATCPLCSDGIDNDGDTMIDYPADSSCFSASDTNETCAQTEPVATITQQVTTGNTAGQVNDFTPECGSGSHSAPDVALQLDLPAMATLDLVFDGFDGATSLLDSTCGGTEIDCSDPDDMELTNIAAGTYHVVVDGWSSGNGPWTLDTTGTVASGGSCEGPLFQAGAFTCATGLSCMGAVGMQTCQ